VELAPQHREVIVILGVKQANPVRGTANLDPVALGERVVRLSVGMKARILAAQKRNRHDGRIPHRDRAVGKRMGRDGNQQDGRHAGVDNGPLRRKSVCRRAGRRCDNQTVGAHRIDEVLVDRHRTIDHSAERAPVHDNVVQREAALALAAPADELGIEQRARLFHVFAVEHGRQRRLHVGKRDVG
jgi:hypothetical protein